MSPVILVVIIVIISLILVGGILLYVKRLASSIAEEVRTQFPQAELLIPNVSFFGQQSKGAPQLRGNGSMAITSQEIYFLMWIPRRVYRIPRSAIQSIENPKSFLGKSRLRPLLKVNFLNEQGNLDAMAWDMPDLAAAQRTLGGH